MAAMVVGNAWRTRRFPLRVAAGARRLVSSDGGEEEGLAQYWRDMERRVSNRKPRPRGQGPSGRGPRRKDEMDYWMAAGLYEFDNRARASVSGRLSTGRVKPGELEPARKTYEEKVAPLLLAAADLIDVQLVVDESRNVLTSLSRWKTPDAYRKVAHTAEYQAAMLELSRHMDGQPQSDDVAVYTFQPPGASSSG